MDPLYEEIMDFIIQYNECCEYETIYYDYFKSVNLEKINKNYISIMNGYRMTKYNYYVFNYIYNYIYIIIKNTHKNIDKFKEIEEYFKLLLIKILTNNYNNIRFDFTLSIIYIDSINIMMKYLEVNSIIYDLDRINPQKFDLFYLNPNMIKRANYIYDKLIRYDKTDLHWSWIGAIVKGGEE